MKLRRAQEKAKLLLKFGHQLILNNYTDHQIDNPNNNFLDRYTKIEHFS